VNTAGSKTAPVLNDVAMRTGTRELKRLHVCHLAYTFYESDNRVIRYAELLAERGDDVEVIALRRAGQPVTVTINNVRVTRIQLRDVTEKRARTYLAKIVVFLAAAMSVLTIRQLRRRYDIVHVHNVPDFLVFAAWLPRLMGAKLILDIHDIVPELYAGKFGSSGESRVLKLLRLVERISCSFVHHVIVSNDLWRKRLLQRAVQAEKVTTFLNYPDLRLFKPIADRSKALDDRFVALYPGTLNNHQGVDVAVRAMALVRDRIPHAELHIYGEGPMRAELDRLRIELKLEETVRIFDRRPLSEIAAIMASADVGVVPKRADGFGNEAFSTKILEFMACGVPVIVSRTRIDRHYFDDTLVRFFTSGDARDLAEAFVEAYENRDDPPASVPEASRLAARYSWQQRSVDYEHLIDSLAVGSVCPRTQADTPSQRPVL
jgi:glycosyltransferase involved in cell wall biosynthesis